MGWSPMMSFVACNGRSKVRSPRWSERSKARPFSQANQLQRDIERLPHAAERLAAAGPPLVAALSELIGAAVEYHATHDEFQRRAGQLPGVADSPEKRGLPEHLAQFYSGPNFVPKLEETSFGRTFVEAPPVMALVLEKTSELLTPHLGGPKWRDYFRNLLSGFDPRTGQRDPAAIEMTRHGNNLAAFLGNLPPPSSPPSAPSTMPPSTPEGIGDELAAIGDYEIDAGPIAAETPAPAPPRRRDFLIETHPGREIDDPSFVRIDPGPYDPEGLGWDPSEGIPA